jgi:hypothetical protein
MRMARILAQVSWRANAVRFLIELTLHSVFVAMASAFVFGVIWALGSPFGLQPRGAALFVLVLIGFWSPALAGVYIAVSGSGGESHEERIYAGVTGFGLLVCSAVLTIPLIATVSREVGLLLFFVGSVLWWTWTFFSYCFPTG